MQQQPFCGQYTSYLAVLSGVLG